MLNPELDTLGMKEAEKVAYWQNKTIQEAINKADSTNRAAIREAYNQAITDLQTIQGAALTTEASQIQAIKGMAGILEKLLKFMKEMIL